MSEQVLQGEVRCPDEGSGLIPLSGMAQVSQELSMHVSVPVPLEGSLGMDPQSQ